MLLLDLYLYTYYDIFISHSYSYHYYQLKLLKYNIYILRHIFTIFIIILLYNLSVLYYEWFEKYVNLFYLLS